MQPDQNCKLTVALFGPLRVCDADGVDVTPTGEKDKALVALLATAPNLSRSRAWLQAKLWSTRGQKQASDSLRKALWSLRKAFGPASDVIEATRGTVSLNAANLEILPRQRTAPGDDEFLQGIDVRDPEFEDWLAAMRAHYDESEPDASAAHRPSPASNFPRPEIIRSPRELHSILVIGRNYSQTPIAELVLMDALIRTAQQSLPVIVYRAMPETAPEQLLRLQITSWESMDKTFHINVSVDGPYSGQAHGTYSATLDGFAPAPNDPLILGLVNRVLSTLPDAFTIERSIRHNAPDAALRAALAVTSMFTMRDEEFHRADQLLADAADINPRGLYLAWRAQLLALRLVERQSGDIDEMRNHSQDLARRAIELAPRNSYVLATVANAQHIFSLDHGSYQDLVQQSLAADPGNPLAWWADSNAKLYAGRAEDAYNTAVTAQTIADSSPLKAFSDFQRALTAAVTGRIDEAIRFAEAAAALVPHFRPPLRYLVGLYSLKGDLLGAHSAAVRLAALEPDFTIERLISDNSYPVSMMRRANLINRDHLIELADRDHDKLQDDLKNTQKLSNVFV